MPEERHVTGENTVNHASRTWRTPTLIILSLFPLAIVPLATALAGRAEAAPGERPPALGAAVREAG